MKDDNGTRPGSIEGYNLSLSLCILFNLVMFPNSKVISGCLSCQHTLNGLCILLDAGHNVFGVSVVLCGPNAWNVFLFIEPNDVPANRICWSSIAI